MSEINETRIRYFTEEARQLGFTIEEVLSYADKWHKFRAMYDWLDFQDIIQHLKSQQSLQKSEFEKHLNDGYSVPTWINGGVAYTSRKSEEEIKGNGFKEAIELLRSEECNDFWNYIHDRLRDDDEKINHKDLANWLEQEWKEKKK